MGSVTFLVITTAIPIKSIDNNRNCPRNHNGTIVDELLRAVHTVPFVTTNGFYCDNDTNVLFTQCHSDSETVSCHVNTLTDIYWTHSKIK